MSLRLTLIALAMTLAPPMARAVDLTIPGSAAMTREIVEEAGSYRLPVGPYSDGLVYSFRVEGAIVQQAWRIEAQGMTTLQILAPMRQQLVDAGFEILFECTAPTCGGFDFRFNTRVMAAPDMFVDLLDFRFLSARRNGQDNGADYVTLLVSRANDSGYVQIIQAGGEQIEVADTPTAPAAGSGSAPPVAPGAAPLSDQPLAQALLDRGHVILSDLDFETGSSALGAGPFASLRALADFLNADSARRVALVGHTDTVGGLEPNIALSRERAASVLSRLAEDYQVPRAQMDAEGAGYLAPIASNRSDHGRESNRRVEVVLLRSE
ncbi:OOP family OmpA-OmpF porin [Roseovarius halotolerans]|uniref:Outer membrane porin F n=2 Tax=Roseovarius halotolerans TaxID=505353 RepID=A0A1X6ZP94_9RHOB|nr:OmpA family protein [Roseovarius halotolerans]RKT28108.1 OOP family OmpA-OmpF porin [Roseovarius halotolerans]SLN57048.1 Outer membrane porin F precursor [Roseovarius halotolerans]